MTLPVRQSPSPSLEGASPQLTSPQQQHTTRSRHPSQGDMTPPEGLARRSSERPIGTDSNVNRTRSSSPGKSKHQASLDPLSRHTALHAAVGPERAASAASSRSGESMSGMEQVVSPAVLAAQQREVVRKSMNSMGNLPAELPPDDSGPSNQDAIEAGESVHEIVEREHPGGVEASDFFQTMHNLHEHDEALDATRGREVTSHSPASIHGDSIHEGSIQQDPTHQQVVLEEAAAHEDAAAEDHFLRSGAWVTARQLVSVGATTVIRQKVAEHVQKHLLDHNVSEPTMKAIVIACAVVPVVLTMVGFLMEEKNHVANSKSRTIRAMNMALGLAVILVAALTNTTRTAAARVVANTFYGIKRDIAQQALPLVNQGGSIRGDGVRPAVESAAAYLPNQVGVGMAMSSTASPSGAGAANSQFDAGTTFKNDIGRGGWNTAGEVTDEMMNQYRNARAEGKALDLKIQPRNPLPHLVGTFTGIGAARPNWLNFAALVPNLMAQCIVADTPVNRIAQELGQAIPGAEMCAKAVMLMGDKARDAVMSALEATALATFYPTFMLQGSAQDAEPQPRLGDAEG
jgi:hypothetical protein